MVTLFTPSHTVTAKDIGTIPYEKIYSEVNAQKHKHVKILISRNLKTFAVFTKQE